MAKLYGTIDGDGRAKPQTRCAHTLTTAAAQSWAGSIGVSIRIDAGGVHRAEISIGTGSTAHPSRVLWEGKLSDLDGAAGLKIEVAR